MAKKWALAELISFLQAKRRATEQQIAGLLAPVGSIEHEIVLNYVLTQSSKDAAALANAKGLRLPGKNPEGREYTPKDVLALVEAENSTLPPGLLDLARLGKGKRTGDADTHWN